MAEKKLSFFDSLLAGYFGQGWPEISKEQRDFLFAQPKNKKGWCYFNVGGFTFHIKSGLDFRNPAVPYLLVKVNGKLILKRMGGGGDYIGTTEGGGFYASQAPSYAGAFRKYIYFPEEGWKPRSEDASFYRKFFYSEFPCYTELSELEVKAIWLASQFQNLPHLREEIQADEAWVVSKGGEYWTGLYRGDIARYMRSVQKVKTGVEKLNLGPNPDVFYIKN